MKFAIRKLAIACVLPTALWQGPLMSDAWAQNFPTANSKVNAGMPQKRMAPTKKAPAAGPQTSTNDNQPQFPAAARPPAVNNSPPVYQVANPAASQQQQQQGNGGGGGETDVQKQLRLLYEKSGQEMPVMDLSEMEVPEPQEGVAPGGPQGGPQGPGQFAQPQVPPQKSPNFFERVFLGKKAPAPQLPPQPRAPMGQQPIRTPNGAPAVAPPAANYRPYQPAPQAQPALQSPQGYNGQRPGMNQPGATAQPNGYPQQQQQPAPQLQLQRPQGQPSVIPQQPNGQVQQPQQFQPQLQLPPPPVTTPQPIQNPPQFNPQQQPTGGSPQVVPPQAPARTDDVPLLDEEPEESLEIDLNPKPAPAVQGNAIIPGVPPSGVMAAPLPTTTGTPKAADAKPAAEPDPAPPEENPFSGLRLSIPEAAAPSTQVPTTPAVPATSGAPNTPAAGPALTPSASPAANAARTATPVATPPAATSLPKQDNPFLDDEDMEDFEEKEKAEVIEKNVKPVAPPAAKVTAPSVTRPALGTNKPLEIAPIMPPGKAASPVAKTPVVLPKKVADEAATAKPPLSAADERLRKLADAPEKTGLKGFCPVALRQKGQLIETKPQFNAVYQGQKFHFSSIAAKAAFEKEPQLFVPVHTGMDGVALLDEDESLPGSLDHAVWYQGHLYLFANRTNREIFVSDPELYMAADESKPTVTKAVSTPEKPAQTATRRPQKTPRAAETAVAAQPEVKATPTAAPATDELPVLSDNLDDLPPLLPVNSNTPEPAAQGPAIGTPALTPVDAGNTGSTTREAPAPAAKPAAQPAAKPSVIQPDPQLELPPMLKNATKNTPASFVAPNQPARSSGTPPRLISPALRLAPSVRQ